MSCIFCEKNKDKPKMFNDKNYWSCPACRQRWWCYNSHFDLWVEVGFDQDIEWEVIKRNCPIPVSTHPVALIPGYEIILPASSYYEKENEVAYPGIQIKILGPKKTPTIMVQCVGKYDKGNILNLQFDFPLASDIHSKYWFGEPEKFEVIYLGPVDQYPHDEIRQQLLGKQGKKERYPNKLYMQVAKAQPVLPAKSFA